MDILTISIVVFFEFLVGFTLGYYYGKMNK